MDQGQQQAEQAPSVASRVLAAFVDAVAEDSELTDVAARLRQTLLERKSLTESSLRQALFGDAAV
jgi:hypothetical protein